MKLIIKTLFILTACFAGIPAFGSQELGTAQVVEGTMTRNGSLMTTDVVLDLSGMKVKSNQAAVFTPMIVNGTDTLKLQGVGVYGRTRWYQYERSGKRPISGEGEKSLRAKKDLGIVTLNQNVNYQEWMDGSHLIVNRQDYGCAGCDLGELATVNLGEYIAPKPKREFSPSFIFEEAIEEAVKARELSGRAYVDFPVNKTVIYPDYRRNSVELAKIIATIDSVKNDKDITVTSLSIKGFASPEGSYENNVRLAMGRTEALKAYVQKLYSFPIGFIKTSFEPEDWEGLREWLLNNYIDNRDAILMIVDSNLEPDPKNAMIQKTYPVQYRYLLENVYPGLRHSDYKIEYQIRSYTDIAEITEIYRVAPQKLSLNELYRYAATLPAGSDAYIKVFDTAAVLYPLNETANLNAANVMMMRKDLTKAQRYLDRAGNSGKALYAKGILKAMQGEYEEAETLVIQAIRMGVEDQNGILLQLRELQEQ